MKRLVLFMTLGIFAVSLMAQKSAVSYADYEIELEKPDLDRAKEKIEEATEHEKTKDWPKTYVVKSKVYRNLYSKKNKDKAFIDAAYEAILKADALDRKGDEKGKKKGKYQKDIRLEMLALRSEIINDGVHANNDLKDYARTLDAFEKVLALDKNETYNQGQETLDTMILYNAMATAYSSQKYDKMIAYANKVIETGYKAEKPDQIYLMLYDSYKSLGDTTNMMETLKTAMVKFPDEKVFLDQLVFHYVEMQNAEEGINYIKQSLAKKPDNANLLFILGTFYDEIGEKDKAIETYEKVNEIPNANKSSVADANYNLGVVYYNKAVEAMSEAQEIKDYKKFKEAEAIALKKFEVCIPYFERVLEVNPNSKETLQALKPVYYRLNNVDKKYSERYKEVTAKLESL